MNVFISLADVVTAIAVVIMLVVIGASIMWGKIMGWRKRKARKLLSDEIGQLEATVKQFEHYRDTIYAMRMRENVICPTLLKAIVDMLPDPNRVSDTSGGVLVKNHPVSMVIPGRGVVNFGLDFIVDRDEENTGEKGMTIRVSPTGQEVRFTLTLQNRKQRFGGVDVDVSGYFWDLRFSGIHLVSDQSFASIIDFVLSSRVVNNAIGLHM